METSGPTWRDFILLSIFNVRRELAFLLKSWVWVVRYERSLWKSFNDRKEKTVKLED